MDYYLICNQIIKKMRILITGFIVFVIWCFISAWLYNDKALPALKKPVAVQTMPATPSPEADSLMKLKASMPRNLLIYFEFDKSRFKPDPQTGNSLAPIKGWLEKYPRSMLLVTGHTDLVGTAEYNLKLGLERARAVEKYLEEQGISAGRMLTESKGSMEPAADYLTAEGRAMNRRTEISIKMK
jgi:outer membrane protein OmpA-like peptidoglycan-associated protein